jgi:YtkA-like protein
MALISAQAPNGGVARGIDRLVRGVFLGAGLLVLGMLIWGHLGLGALLLPPANAPSVQTAMAGPYEVSFARPEAGFAVGKDNTALIALSGSNGAVLERAQLTVRQEMTTMAMSVPPATITAKGNGLYEARMTFSMAGPWRVTVIIWQQQGVQNQVTFDAGVRW